jgi:hypothetical protein
VYLFDYSGSCDVLSETDVEWVNIINTDFKGDFIFFEKGVFVNLAFYKITYDVPSKNQLHSIQDNMIILGEIN